MKISISVIFLFLFIDVIFAQEDTTTLDNSGFIIIDSTNKFVPVENINDLVLEIDTSYIKSPRKAAILSAMCPGLGQIYNEKYWKAPVFFGLFGVASYGVYYTFSQYYKYLHDYVNILKGIPPRNNLIKTQDVIDSKDFYKKYRDYSVIAWLAIYGLNIADANINAYFSKFDVSEDLTLNISPSFSKMYNNTSFGMNIVLYF